METAANRLSLYFEAHCLKFWNIFRQFVESMTTHRQTTGRHDNSATALFHRQPTRRHDHWPTRQVTDIFFKKTHRHSPTLTDRDFPRKRMKRNIQQNRDSGYVPGYNLIRLQFECICLCSQVGDTPSTTSHCVHGSLCICSLQKLICFCPFGIGWTKKPVAILINRKPKCPGKMYKKSVIYDLRN